MKRITVLVALILVLSLVLTAGCGQKASQPGGGQAPADPKKTLIVAMPADLGTLDPAVTMDNASWKITYPAYDRLVKYKVVNGAGSTEVEPSLALKWDVAGDGLTWTFSLRKDAKFHDGAPVNAQAVKFSFDRLTKIKKGPMDYFPMLKAVDVVDDYTVKFTLSQPFPPFLSTLAVNAGNIINPKVMEKEKDGDLAQGWLAEHTAGSGPYQLVEWQKDQQLKLLANPNYWGGKPKLEVVIAKVIKESSSQRLQLEKGDVDIAEGILTDQLKELKKNADLVVAEYPSLTVDYVYINNEKPALKDPRVRQALSYAIDYQGIIQHEQQGYATQMRGPVPEGLWGHDAGAKQYTRDVAKAKELLAQAGVKDLKIKLLYSDRKAWWEQEALTIQANLAEIGVKVELEKLAWATMREKVDKGDFDLSLGVWSPDFGDPYMFMNYWFDSKNFGLAGNRSRYKNDQVDQLIREAAQVSDQAKRVELYKLAQKIVIDEAAYIYLYQFNYLLPMRQNVKGFVYNPMLDNMYNFESMSKE